jgi:hypothetical protein
LDEEYLGGEGLLRVNKLKGQSDPSIETIRANAHVDPQQQIDLARYVRLHARELHPACCGAASRRTTRSTRFAICSSTLCGGAARDVVRNDHHLAFLLTQLRQLGGPGLSKLKPTRRGLARPPIPATRVENALEFLRKLGLLQLPPCAYRPDFAVRVENLMLPPPLAALDDYGVPLQLVARLEPFLPAGSDLDVCSPPCAPSTASAPD